MNNNNKYIVSIIYYKFIVHNFAHISQKLNKNHIFCCSLCKDLLINFRLPRSAQILSHFHFDSNNEYNQTNLETLTFTV